MAEAADGGRTDKFGASPRRPHGDETGHYGHVAEQRSKRHRILSRLSSLDTQYIL